MGAPAGGGGAAADACRGRGVYEMNAVGTRLSRATSNAHFQTKQARGAEAARYKAALRTSQTQGEQLRTQLELATSALEATERKLGAANERCAALAGQGTYVDLLT